MMTSVCFTSHVGYSMGSQPQNTQVFPNRMKLSEFVDHNEQLKIY
jgi:hypothetical protein